AHGFFRLLLRCRGSLLHLLVQILLQLGDALHGGGCLIELVVGNLRRRLCGASGRRLRVRRSRLILGARGKSRKLPCGRQNRGSKEPRPFTHALLLHFFLSRSCAARTFCALPWWQTDAWSDGSGGLAEFWHAERHARPASRTRPALISTVRL